MPGTIHVRNLPRQSSRCEVRPRPMLRRVSSSFPPPDASLPAHRQGAVGLVARRLLLRLLPALGGVLLGPRPPLFRIEDPLLGEALQRAVKLLEIEHAIARQKVEVIAVEFATVLQSALEGLLRPSWRRKSCLRSSMVCCCDRSWAPTAAADTRHSARAVQANRFKTVLPAMIFGTPRHLSSLVTGPKSLRFVYAVGDERP